MFLLLDLGAELDLEPIDMVTTARRTKRRESLLAKMVLVLLLDTAFRVPTDKQQPDHRRISDFRRRHLCA